MKPRASADTPRARGARVPVGTFETPTVHDPERIANKLRPPTPETVHERVEHCRQNPNSLGGPGAAALDALFEIGCARAHGFAWAAGGGGKAPPPDENDPEATIEVPAWIVAALAIPWTRFRKKEVQTLDEAFGVAVEGRHHFAERRKTTIRSMGRALQVMEVQRQTGWSEAKAIEEVADKTGAAIRTLGDDMRRHRDSLRHTFQAISTQKRQSDRDPVA